MRFRIVLLSVVGLALAPMALRSAAFAGAAASGLAMGILLAVWGASQTRFEQVGNERYYVPHTYTGIAVSLLFIGRVAFRLLQAYGMARAVPATGMSANGYGYFSSPLTFGLFFVVMGYWVTYLGWILWKSTQVSSQNSSPLGAGPGAPS